MKKHFAVLAIFISCVMSATAEVAYSADSAQSAVTTRTVYAAAPVELTALDFVTKIFGIVDPASDRDQLIDRTRELTSLTPEADDTGLWLESDGGYIISYYGMHPDCAAMAQYAGDQVADFGFFFLFPYSGGSREISNDAQAYFCGALLQELHDLGLDMGVNPMTDAIFEAIGEYQGNLVEVRLVDECYDPTRTDGRYVIAISVEPAAYTDADTQMAALSKIYSK